MPLLWGTYKGFTKGLIYEVALFVALLLGVYGGLKFSGFASGYIADKWQVHGAALPFISFLSVFIAIVFIIILLAKLLEGATSLVAMGWLNKAGGALLGLCKWTLLVSMLFYFIVPIDTKWHLLSEKTKQESKLYNPVSNFSMLIVPKLKDYKEKIMGNAPSLKSF